MTPGWAAAPIACSILGDKYLRNTGGGGGGGGGKGAWKYNPLNIANMTCYYHTDSKLILEFFSPLHVSASSVR